MPKMELKEDKIYTRKKLVLKVLYILYISFILYLLFSNLSIECKQRRIESKDSTINLKMKGPGNYSILSSYFNYLPAEIIINTVTQSEIARFYDFTEPLNSVTLK